MGKKASALRFTRKASELEEELGSKKRRQKVSARRESRRNSALHDSPRHKYATQLKDRVGNRAFDMLDQATGENEDENIGAEALTKGYDAVELTESTSSSIKSRIRQRQQIKKAYTGDGAFGTKMGTLDTAGRGAGRGAAGAGASGGAAGRGAASGAAGSGNSILQNASSSLSGAFKNLGDKGLEYVSSHSRGLLIGGAVLMLFFMISGLFSSCSAMASGGGNAIIATTYTAEDEDILGANSDYTSMEATLQGQIDHIEQTYPGYDEYNYNLAQIGHDPYQLASYLTVLYEAYTREQVQETLQQIFDQQYELTFEERTEIRTRMETRTEYQPVLDYSTTPPTILMEEHEVEEEVEYEYRILDVTLMNRGMTMTVGNSDLSEDLYSRWTILNQTKGNKPYLFEDEAFIAAGSDYLHYDIPGEALTDERFGRMIHEAERYLGYPYVWGGASPSTSFDCSGYVSWVINHCGNGWNYGRRTAEGLRQTCSIIPASAARPGDLIFFQGTYNTTGASHVGIVVDPVNKVMIHCGNPISYAYYNTNYWTQHFYCIGRLP